MREMSAKNTPTPPTKFCLLTRECHFQTHSLPFREKCWNALSEDAVAARRLRQGDWGELKGHKSCLGLMSTQKLKESWIQGVLVAVRTLGRSLWAHGDRRWQSLGLHQQSCYVPAPLGGSETPRPKITDSLTGKPALPRAFPRTFPTTSPLLLAPVPSYTSTVGNTHWNELCCSTRQFCKSFPYQLQRNSPALLTAPTFSSFGEFHLACVRLSFP